jgi:hypothetical protein
LCASHPMTGCMRPPMWSQRTRRRVRERFHRFTAQNRSREPFANPQSDVSCCRVSRRQPGTAVRCVVRWSGRIAMGVYRKRPSFRPHRCSRICSCESLQEPQRATENNEAAATDSVQSICDHQVSTAFNRLWNPVRDQGVGGSNPLSPTIFLYPFRSRIQMLDP